MSTNKRKQQQAITTSNNTNPRVNLKPGIPDRIFSIIFPIEPSLLLDSLKRITASFESKSSCSNGKKNDTPVKNISDMNKDFSLNLSKIIKHTNGKANWYLNKIKKRRKNTYATLFCFM